MAVWRNTTYYDDAPFTGESAINCQMANDATRVDRGIQLDTFRDVSQAAQDFLGFPRVVSAGAVKWISRTTPHAFPDVTDDNGQPFCYAQSFQRCEGLGVRGNTPRGGPDYQRAKVRVIYSSLTYKILEDNDQLLSFNPASGQLNPLAGHPDEATLARHVTRLYKPFHRAITVPRALLRWNLIQSGFAGLNDQAPAGSSVGPPVFEGTSVVEAGILLEYIWHLTPSLPINAIGSTVGKLNSVAFDGFPAETLLCESPEIAPIISPIGQRLYDIRYRFRWMPHYSREGSPSVQRGWNWFLRFCPQQTPGVPAFDYRRLSTTGDAGGDPLLQGVDYCYLFRPE